MQMHKKRIEKDDGRFLYYYWFDDEPEPVVEEPGPADSQIENPKSTIENPEVAVV